MTGEVSKSWINTQTYQIILAPNEKPLMENWKRVKITSKLSFTRKLKENLIIIGSFCVYALLLYIFTDNPIEKRDAAARALFFPLFIYIFTAYRSMDKYILGLFSGFLLIYGFYPLIYLKWITKEGILFIYYFENVTEFFYTGLIPENPSLTMIMQASSIIFAGIMVFESILFVLRRIFSKKQTIEFFLSENTLYLRGKSHSIFFTVIWKLLWIIITPLNIYNYRDLAKQFQYRRESKKEGFRYDFARIPAYSITKMNEKPTFKWTQIVVSVGLIVIGILSTIYIFVLIGIFLLFPTIRAVKKKLKNISVGFSYNSVDGSWIKRNVVTIISFHELNQELVQYFHAYHNN